MLFLLLRSIIVLTIVESWVFQKQWPLYWTEEERGEFAAYLTDSPYAGDVVPGAGGVRKVRWSRQGRGNSSGVRVVYYLRLDKEQLVLLTLYSKSKLSNLTVQQLKELRNAIEK